MSDGVLCVTSDGTMLPSTEHLATGYTLRIEARGDHLVQVYAPADTDHPLASIGKGGWCEFYVTAVRASRVPDAHYKVWQVSRGEGARGFLPELDPLVQRVREKVAKMKAGYTLDWRKTGE